MAYFCGYDVDFFFEMRSFARLSHGHTHPDPSKFGSVTAGGRGYAAS